MDVDDYFEELRKGGPGYQVLEKGPNSFMIFCDQKDDDAIRAFRSVVNEAIAHRGGNWEVKPGPTWGFSDRSIPGLQDPVYLAAAIWKW
ncbi:hypothetical protein [Bradyrhizobium jicamae]|uniref:hypothetical protein n=1 Tax=Bradyrhizobium jicamae TaxID=280332 RepID=UPI001BA768D9|nr:hypothetical protein [Bradyrhizobium jicamae]MBR0939446.1 hypothetical protein [Bradyrhizobium jicamae]